MNYQCVCAHATMQACCGVYTGAINLCMNSSVYMHMPSCKHAVVHGGHQPLHEFQGTNSGLSGLHCKDLHPLRHLSSPDKLNF